MSYDIESNNGFSVNVFLSHFRGGCGGGGGGYVILTWYCVSRCLMKTMACTALHVG